MRIGVELAQLHRSRSGGIVPLLERLLLHAFVAGGEHQFFVYESADGYHIPVPVTSTVQVRQLSGTSWYAELDRSCVTDEIDVLLRCFPSDEPCLFPLPRQIVFIPDLQHEALPECFSPEALELRRLAFNRAISDAGSLAVISEHARADLLRRHPETDGRVVVVPPALTTLAEAEAAPGGEVVLPPRPFFLYPANLWPHKNHRRLFAAFRLFLRRQGRKHALYLTGDPTGWSELSAECTDLPVKHLGFVSPEHLAALYRAADALTYFSLYEGFGLPLLEAFHFGTPVLCSKTTSLPEIAGDAALMCDPTDVEGMATLMARLAGDGNLRAELIAQGRSRPDCFSWERSAGALLGACSRVAATPIDFGMVRSILQSGQALLDRLQASEADRAARLEALQASEADRAARLEALQASEADRAARLEAIEWLKERLEVTERRLNKLGNSPAVRAERLLARMVRRLTKGRISPRGRA